MPADSMFYTLETQARQPKANCDYVHRYIKAKENSRSKRFNDYSCMIF